jgi:hypothetical protein
MSPTKQSQDPPQSAAAGSSEPQHDREQSIRERAYAIWERQGQPHGQDAAHWAEAEQEHDKAADGS